MITAGIIHKVTKTASNGIPLGAEIDPEDYKVIFIDIALAQMILGANRGTWFLQPLEEFVNKGTLVETFIGQELLVYNYQDQKTDLYYWRRTEKTNVAEVDYVLQKNTSIIPIKVKSGAGTTLKSMQLFLDLKKQSPYGLRFSTQNYSLLITFIHIHYTASLPR